MSVTTIADQSFEAIAGTILNLFDFENADEDHGASRKLILDPDSGEPVLP